METSGSLSETSYNMLINEPNINWSQPLNCLNLLLLMDLLDRRVFLLLSNMNTSRWKNVAQDTSMLKARVGETSLATLQKSCCVLFKNIM